MIDLIGGVIQNLEECEKAIQGVQIESPFINGCELDWNDEDQVNSIMECYDDNDLGVDPFAARRRF